MPCGGGAREVGVAYGDTSETLLSALPTLRLLMVDPLEAAAGVYMVPEKRSPLRDRLRPFGGRGALLLQRSPEAAAWLADGSVDLVFVDGDHNYEPVRQDLAAWRPKLRAGGILAGHDYSLVYPGVVQAVNEFVHRAGAHLNLASDTVWWIAV